MQDNFFGETVYTYSRANAIADGVLVDVTQQAGKMGFKVPVALTATVWQDCVLWTGEVQQDQAARLNDVLAMAYRAARNTDGDLCKFDVLRVARDNGQPGKVTLKMLIGPGDDPAPVITIMLPNED